MYSSRTKLHKLLFLACAILSLAALGVTQNQDQPTRGPSTPEERKRFVAIAHKM